MSTGFDYEKVLPRCRAAVHHGGAGTTHTVVRAGIPAVIAHVFADQPFWAGQVENLGLGLGVGLPFRRLDADRLHDALSRALDPDVAVKATQYADLLGTDNGVTTAADVLSRT